MKRKEKCVYTDTIWFRVRISYGSSNRATHIHTYTIGIQARIVYFDHFSLFLRFSSLYLSATFFSSFSFPLAFTLLLRYRTTWLLFLSFFFFLILFFIPSCPPFTLFARFFPLSFSSCSSFLSPLFLLLTTQRGIRTLDFSTTKLENKRRNVSH